MTRTLRLYVSALAAMFIAAACSSDTSPVDSGEPQTTTRLVLSLSSHHDTVPEATTLTLVARVTDAAGILQSKPVEWASTSPEIASVVQGLVTGVSVGTTKVTATTTGGVADTATIVVTENGVTVDIQPSAAAVVLGDTLHFVATARTRSGDIVAVNQYTWSSSDSLVASFADAGILRTNSEGDVTVAAEALMRRGESRLRILSSPAASVSITPGTANVYEGATIQLEATVRDVFGRHLRNADVTWGSSNFSRATVNQDGQVTGVEPGVVVITATSQTRTASASIYVLSAPAVSLELDVPSDTVLVGATLRATATPRDADGNPIAGRAVSWQSSNPAIATVTSSGVIRGVVEGSTNIRAVSDGLVATERINVRRLEESAAPVATVLVAPQAITCSIGETVTLTALAYAADQSPLLGRAVTWSSSNPSVAVVSAGLVTAVGAGTARIEAMIEGKVASTTVTVTTAAPAAVAQVIVSVVATNLQVGQTTQATAVLKDAANNVLTGRAITWYSLDESVATVSSTGRVTAVGAGTIAIMAMSEGVSGSASVAVATSAPAPVAAISIEASGQISVGQQVQTFVVLKDASGKTLTGRTITYSTQNPAVATVSAMGVVTGMGAGTARVQVTSGGVSASKTFTVSGSQSAPPPPPPPPPTISSIAVSASQSSLSVGGTTQASAVAKDDQGNVMSATFAWTTSNSSVATVSSSGLITAASMGSATITAASSGKTGTLQIAVTGTVPVASVTLTLNPSTIPAGATSQASAILKDANGNVLTGRTVAFSSSKTSVATVGTTGIVRAVAAGAAMIIATSSGVTASAPLTVDSAQAPAPPPPPPPPPSASAQAELPRRVPVVPSNLSTLACTVNVPAGGLQSALNAAKGGAVLCVTGTHTGNFQVPARTDAGWVVIRSAGSIPSGRIRPSTAGSLAKIVSPNVVSALRLNARSVRTLVLGVEITGPCGPQSGPETVSLIEVGTASENTLADLPDDIAFDRVYVHGCPTQRTRRAFLVGGRALTVVNSWCDEIHSDFDSQCFMAWNSTGPYLIENNTLKATSENIMFGGAPPRVPGVIPSDATIRRNHIAKSIVWKNAGWNSKTLLESKASVRVLVENNVFDGTWQEAQDGHAVLLKSVNVGGNATHSRTSDWIVRRNLFQNIVSGFNIAGKADGTVTDSSNQRILIEENWLEPLNVAPFSGANNKVFSLLSNNRDVVIRGNTVEDGNVGTAVSILKRPNVFNLTFTNNAMPRGQYGFFLGGSTQGLTSWTNGPEGNKVWSQIAFIGSAPNVAYPPGTGWHSALNAAISAAGSVTRATIDAATAGVVVPP